MAKTREIKGRLKAVGNIKRITRTMQMIATSKFQNAMRRATATRPFTDKVSELVGHLAAVAGGDGSVSHPLLGRAEAQAGRRLLLVITSNRGLCGGYNANVLRTASANIREHDTTALDLEVAGRKGIAYFRFVGRQIARPLTHFADQPTYDQVNALASEYMQWFGDGRYDAIDVAYMRFVSNSRQVPTVDRLLPLEPDQLGDDEAGESHEPTQYDFSPEPQALLDELLPLTVKTRLFQFFNEAVVSEQIARMVAMKAATDNAEDMGRRLRRQFNRARQTQITTELNEVVSGAEALA